MEPDKLEQHIIECLNKFYRRRLKNLSTLKLKEVLKRRNPYLMRAIGIGNAAELVEYLLTSHTQASDEGIFGDAFIEPLVLLICESMGGHKSGAKGIDIEIVIGSNYKAIAVKSGPNIFNSSQTARMNDEFQELQNRLRQHLKSLGKQFDPILGSAYGSRDSAPTKKRLFRTLAGQAFWKEITGDPDFYIRLVQLMREHPSKHRLEYKEEWDKAINRFAKELLNQFAKEDGSLDWEAIVRYNSA